jgi:hypothetical protein
MGRIASKLGSRWIAENASSVHAFPGLKIETRGTHFRGELVPFGSAQQ